jgi:Na+-transporting methylmalonyl-CoA/oxaloacetate decarboxylase beta subunit
MNYGQTLIAVLTEGIRTFTWANAVMLAIGTLLIYLAIVRRYEPLLLLPIGAGCLFANLGMSAYTPEGLAGHDLRFRHSHRVVPAADLHRRRCDDRLSPAVGAAAAWC